MDYSKISDEEINELVTKQLILSGFYTDDAQEVSHRQYVSKGWCWGRGTETGLRNRDGSVFVTHQNGFQLNYCNDASVAWPIIIRNRISILDQLTEWCVDANGVCPVFDKNPLRAAMIVFLMMQDSANVPANSTGPDIR
ncbi:phage protein NinX family protein [Citrobacter werkmanii]|uniref:phage protein NinX family protein n=1 Tax=Citrobacter werkmanii TaxID=67827 RepID=UPI00132FBAE1|nr:phage protein NinX family protein [Citrobacter werkmanii]